MFIPELMNMVLNCCSRTAGCSDRDFLVRSKTSRLTVAYPREMAMEKHRWRFTGVERGILSAPGEQQSVRKQMLS